MTWFGTPFDRRQAQRAFATALERRGVALDIRVALDRSAGLVAITTVRGRDKEAARRRRAAYAVFLDVRGALCCDRHAPSGERKCDACLSWMNVDVLGPCCCADDGQHRWRPPRCAACNAVWSDDLEDLRAELRATAPTVGGAA